MNEGSILIVDDEVELCRSLQEVLADRGWQSVYTTEPTQAFDLATNLSVEACIMDVRMPQIGGLQLLERLKQQKPELPVVMITGYPNMSSAVTAMRLGALNVYPKPIDIDALVSELGQVITRRSAVVRDSVHLQDAPASSCDGVQQIDKTVSRVAGTEASVLLTGESGTGKERIAARIHEESRRASGPFVKINCAAIPATLLESELFGHEKGAFTGAHRCRKGSFEEADGGTMFLDEIGDMSLDLQAKILRAVQEREFERVGGGQVRVNARIVSASNRNLLEMVRAGTFREDLYYRLAVVTVDLLPLRERAEDIHALFVFFLNHYCALYDISPPTAEPALYDALRLHDWPGNIRELKNLAERTAIFCDSGHLTISDLPVQYRPHSLGGPKSTYAEASDSFDRLIIRDALAQAAGNRQRAAELLQIHRKTLYNKMRRLGME